MIHTMRFRGATWLYLTLGYLLLQWVTPLVSVPPPAAMTGTVLVTLVIMALQLGLVAVLARQEKQWFGPVLLLGGLVVWVFVSWLGLYFFVPSPQGLPPQKLAWLPFYRGWLNYFLLLAAIGLGRTLSLLIREPNLLVPIVPFAAIVDILTVFAPAGYVKQTLEKAPEVVQKLSVSIPAVSPPGATPWDRLSPILIIGVGDFVFLGLYLACLYRFQLRVRPTLLWMYLVLTAYLLFILLVPNLTKLPALVPMAIVFLVVNWRLFKLTRTELISTVVVILLASFLLGFYFWR